MAEEKHSLQTEILLDFGQSLDEAKKVATTILSVDTALQKTSQSVKYLEKGIMEQVREIAKDLKSADLDINGSKLRAKIEREIVRAIAARPVHITGLESDKAMKINLGQEATDKVRQKLKTALIQAANKATIEKVNLKQFDIHLDSTAMHELHSQFKTKLTEALNKGAKFKWANGAENLPEDLSVFYIEPKHYLQVVDAFRDKIIKDLTRKNAITIAGLDAENAPKMDFQSEHLRKIFDHLQKAFAAVDAQLQTDIGKFEGLADIPKKMAEMRQQMREAVASLFKLHQTFKDFQLLDDPKEMQKFINELDSMRRGILNTGVKLMRSMITVIKEHPMSTIQQADIMNELTKIDTALSKHINDRIKGAVKSLYKQLGFSIINVDGNEVITNGIKDIQDRIHKATERAIKNLSKAKFGIDTDIIATQLRKWSQYMTEQLRVQTREALVKLTASMLANNKEVMNQFAQSLGSVMKLELERMFKKDERIILKVPVKEMLPHLTQEMQRIVNQLSKEFNFDSLAKGVDTSDLKIPKSVFTNMNQAMRKAYTETAKQYTQSIKQQHQTAMSDEETAKVAQFLDKETKAIIGNILRQARNVMQGFGEKFAAGKLGVNPLGQEKMHTELEETLSGIYSNYMGSLKNVLNLYIKSARAFNEVKESMVDEIKQISALAKQEFARVEITKGIKQSITSLQAKIRSAIKDSVEKWEPNLPPISPTLATKEIMKPIVQAIKIFTSALAMSVIEETTKLLDTRDQIAKGKGKDNKKVQEIRNILKEIDNDLLDYLKAHVSMINTAMRQVKAEMNVQMKSIHADVQKMWANKANMSVADLRKDFPVLKGEKGLQKAIDGTIQVINDKFNDVVLKQTGYSLNFFKNILDKVDIKPDLEPVHFAAKQIGKTQKIIVNKIMEMLKLQFTTLQDMINNINVKPVTVGYEPPKKLMNKLASSAKEQAKAEIEQGAAQAAATMKAPRSVGMSGTRFGSNTGSMDRWSPVPIPVRNGSFAGVEGGGDTRSFMGSIVNTMRYIMAGTAIGVPTMMFHEAYQSAKEFDYQMAKAEVNFNMKDLNEAAQKRLAMTYGQEALAQSGQQLTGNERDDFIVDAGASRLQGMSQAERDLAVANETYAIKQEARTEAIPYLQNFALANAIDLEEVGKAYHISSRRFDDPREALAMTREVARVRSVEEVDVEKVAKGFEAIGSQWGLGGRDMKSVANMMLMAANQSQATIEDLLAIQQRSGALFRRNLEYTSDGDPMTKRQAIATSIALGSMFVQSTARSGGEGGTFFKAILERPFTKDGAAELEALSAKKGFEDLNPWVEKEDGTKRQKNAIEMISSIITATRQMDDQSKKDVLKTVYPAWHEPTMGAMTEFFNDLEKDFERSNRILNKVTGQTADTDKPFEGNVQDAIQNYIDKIANMTDDQALMLQAGMMDTWKFKTQTAKTMWQVSTFGVFEDLKPAFGQLISYLQVVLRLVRENSNDFANVIQIIGKVAAYAGFKFAKNQVSGWMDERRQNRLTEHLYNPNATAMNTEARAVRLHQNVLQDEINQRLMRHETIKGQAMDIDEQLNTKKREYAELQRRATLEETSVAVLMSSPDSPDKETAKKNKAQELKDLHGRGKQIGDEIKQLEGARESKGLEMKQNVSGYVALTNMLNQVDHEAYLLNGRMTMLQKGMTDLGVDSDKLKISLDMLSTNATMLSAHSQKGAISVQELDKSINKMANDAGMGDDDISKFRREVEQLLRTFRQGGMTLTQFKQQVENLDRAHMTGALGVPNGGVNGDTAKQWGMGLMGSVMAVSMLKDGMSFGKRGLGQRVKDAWSTRSVGALFGKSPILRDRDGKVVKGEDGKATRLKIDDPEMQKRLDLEKEVAKQAKPKTFLGKVGSALKGGTKSVLKKVPFVGQALLFTDALGSAMDAFAATGMEGFEKKEVHAEKLKNMMNQVESMDSMSYKNPMKYLTAIDVGFGYLFDGINSYFGGNAPSFTESNTALGTAWNKDGTDLNKSLEQELKQKELEDEAKMEREKYLLKTRWDADGDGKIDDNLGDGGLKVSAEETDKMLGRLKDDLEIKITKNDSEMTVAKSWALIRGNTENSKEVRDIMLNYYDKQLVALQGILSELQKAYAGTVEGKEKDKIAAEIASYDAQIAGINLEMKRTRDSAMDDVLEKLQQDLDLKEAEYSIQESKAQIGGASEDSPVYEKIRGAKAKDMGSRMEQAQGELTQLLKGYATTDDRYRQIWLNIQQIEAKQQGLLADIKKNTEKSISTFNLPSGMQAMSYYDYMTRNATYKNVSAKAGDVTISINIDKMTGDTTDAERMAAVVAGAVKDARGRMASRVADNVKAGHGNSYRTW